LNSTPCISKINEERMKERKEEGKTLRKREKRRKKKTAAHTFRPCVHQDRSTVFKTWALKARSESLGKP
jgi:hypothetical protein